MNAPEHPPIRLTQFSHGGGCGCKIAPGVLRQILDNAPHLPVPDTLLVGIETSDDAAVYRLNDRQAIVATTDFFTPVVDDPFDFGAIAAANALSDVYAMGGTPLFALAIVGMPVATLPLEAIRRILDGGQSICAKAGIPVAGGHTIDTVEPIYGLVAIGVVDPERLKRNADARDGDVIILGKPLGIGITSWIALQTGIARAPKGVGLQTFIGAICLCGIGDTVALLMADQAFPNGDDAAIAKIGVLIGSALAAALCAAIIAARSGATIRSEETPATA